MNKIIISSAFLAATLSGCATIEKGKDTICANKAKIIGAAQATIDSLNAYCPLTDGVPKNGDAAH